MPKVTRRCGHEEEFEIPVFKEDPSLSDDDNNAIMMDWDAIQIGEAEKAYCASCARNAEMGEPGTLFWGCGHDVTEEDLAKSPVLQKGKYDKPETTIAMKAMKKDCPACYIKKANEGMPDLQGTPGQVKFANDVRRKKLKAARKEPMIEEINQLMNAYASIHEVRWWLDNQMTTPADDYKSLFKKTKKKAAA